jgi:hypothetical protein
MIMHAHRMHQAVMCSIQHRFWGWFKGLGAASVQHAQAVRLAVVA